MRVSSGMLIMTSLQACVNKMDNWYTFPKYVYVYAHILLWLRGKYTHMHVTYNVVGRHKIFNMLHGRVTITVTANYVYLYKR